MCRRSEAEVSAMIACAEIAGAAADHRPLSLLAGTRRDHGPDAVSIRSLAYKLHCQPVVGSGCLVMQEVGRAAVGAYEDIHFAIVVVVSPGEPARDKGSGKRNAGSCAYL